MTLFLQLVLKRGVLLLVDNKVLFLGGRKLVMEDDTNSWIRRAKYSHTICHRLDTSRLDPIPINIQSDQQNPKSEQNSTFQSEQNPKSEQNSTSEQNSKPEQNLRSSSEIQRNRIPSKQRSLSPLPQTFLNEVFREAKHEQKRFSTPGPRREKRVTGKLSNKESRESKASSSKTPPNGNSPSRKRKSKHRKEFSWTKYLENSGSGENVTSSETPEDYTVDMSKLFIGLRFAHGAHSRLYHGEYNGDPVAVKVIRVPEEEESGALASKLENQFTREVTLLSRLHHPNVIKFIAASRKPQVYCIITEYLSEGSLRAYLHKLERKTISLQKLVTFALDICRGMTYIHSQGFIHRDLKPENILINEDFRLIIADFGIACEEAVCDLMADDPGTYRWMAPEMIKRKSYGRKVDVYGFGLILWEMLTGTVPYEDMNPIQAAFAVVNKKQRPVIPSDCPPAMRALIEQCWSLQPDKRPDFWQIVKVLEQFESSLAREGTLALVQNPCYQDQKKGLLHWIQKLGPVHQNNNGPVPKPKFI